MTKKPENSFWQRFKFIGIAVAVVIWVYVVISAASTNPSQSSAREKLRIMSEDMDILMAQGGGVVSTAEIAKYGGAGTSRVIAMEGFSENLISKYESELIRRGWRMLNRKPVEYCKNGVLFRSDETLAWLIMQV